MKEISYLIKFDHKNQHFQCYSHILNIAVQDMLKQLGLETESDEYNVDDENEEESEDDDEDREQTDDEQILSDTETTSQASPITKLRNLLKYEKIQRSGKINLKAVVKYAVLKCCPQILMRKQDGTLLVT